MRLVFADEARACVYICAPHSMMTLVFADEASESASVVRALICVCLLCMVQHDETGLC